jgi:hypothetical protein
MTDRLIVRRGYYILVIKCLLFYVQSVKFVGLCCFRFFYSLTSSQLLLIAFIDYNHLKQTQAEKINLSNHFYLAKQRVHIV